MLQRDSKNDLIIFRLSTLTIWRTKRWTCFPLGLSELTFSSVACAFIREAGVRLIST